eukprot:7153593-Prymnesium_polylepis.1
MQSGRQAPRHPHGLSQKGRRQHQGHGQAQEDAEAEAACDSSSRAAGWLRHGWRGTSCCRCCAGAGEPDAANGLASSKSPSRRPDLDFGHRLVNLRSGDAVLQTEYLVNGLFFGDEEVSFRWVAAQDVCSTASGRRRRADQDVHPDGDRRAAAVERAGGCGSSHAGSRPGGGGGGKPGGG